MDVASQEDPHGQQFNETALAKRPHLQALWKRPGNPHTPVQGLHFHKAGVVSHKIMVWPIYPGHHQHQRLTAWILTQMSEEGR